MKKILFVLLFLPSLAGAANVTQAQVQQANAAAIQLVQASVALQQYTNYVNNLFNQNFQFNVAYSTNPVTVSGQTQADLINVQQYQTLKANLVTIFNQLP